MHLEFGEPGCYIESMPNDLYDRDVLAWSENQAALLRRVARGERVNDVDWAHVVEEIEDVGKSEKRELQSRLPLGKESGLQHRVRAATCRCAARA